MWIFDSYYKGCVELWGRDKRLTNTSAVFPTCFHIHLTDHIAHSEIIERLEALMLMG